MPANRLLSPGLVHCVQSKVLFTQFLREVLRCSVRTFGLFRPHHELCMCGAGAGDAAVPEASADGIPCGLRFTPPGKRPPLLPANPQQWAGRQAREKLIAVGIGRVSCHVMSTLICTLMQHQIANVMPPAGATPHRRTW